MAPLTWRNVDAPDLGRAADILNSVSQNWGQGFDALSGALDRARENQIRNRSAGAFDILARAASENDVAGALDQISSTVRPQDRSAELTQAMLNLRGAAQGYDTSRLNQRVTAAANERTQTTHDRKIAVEDQLAGMAKDIVAAQENAMYGPRADNVRSTAGGALPYNDRELLARTLMAEAGGEGFGGMIAAGSVINNRVRSGKYGDGIRGVIMKPGQFSAWNSVTGYAGGKGGLDMANMQVSEDAYRAADTLLSGQYQDITGGATHYYNPAAADPDWGQKAGGQWTRIGNHVFGNPDGSSGSGQAPRISDLIREGNLIDPATLMGFVTDIQNSGDEASRDRDDDRDRDFEFGTDVVDRERSDAEWQRGEDARIIAEQAMERVFTMSNIGNADEAVDAVMKDPELTPQEKQATIDAFRVYQERNPEFFAGPGRTASELEIDGYDPMALTLAIEQAQANRQFNNATNPNLRALDLTGEGSTYSEESVLDWLSNLQKMGEEGGVELLGTQNDVVTAINRVAAEYGLDQGVVAQAAENAITGRLFGGGKVKINEAMMRKALEVYGNRDAFQGAMAQRSQQNKRIELMEEVQNRAAQLVAQIDMYSSRGTPEADARAAQLREELAVVMQDFNALLQQDNAANPSPAALEREAAEAARLQKEQDALLAGARDAYASKPDPSTLPPSPGGITVDRDAPQFIQNQQEIIRKEDIDKRIYDIRNKLFRSTNELSRAMGGLTDFFKSPEEAEKNSSRRQQEAAAVKWYETYGATKYFNEHPEDLVKASEDPVGFFTELMKKQEEKKK